MAEPTVKPIGGYFELELPTTFGEFHSGAIALNSGRSCIEYILRCRNYSKIYVPYFTCASVIEPIQKLGISYEFYHIGKDYRITDNITLSANEALIYTNYWGMQSRYCEELSARYGNRLILDCSQAFYAKPIAGIDTFYSCRKFFGVPDGGYLYTDAIADFHIGQDKSHARINPLIKRIDLSPEDGYNDFRQCSESFHNAPLLFMSKFTKRMMSAIDYKTVAQKRRTNYEQLRRALGGKELDDGEVPMIFPYVSEHGRELRNRLIQNKIFVAKYWPDVDKRAGETAVETWMANHILPLPIDQRYGTAEMEYIIRHIP